LRDFSRPPWLGICSNGHHRTIDRGIRIAPDLATRADGVIDGARWRVGRYDPARIAARLEAMGVASRIDRNPANRTSGGDQLMFTGPDNCRVQLSANGYQG